MKLVLALSVLALASASGFAQPREASQASKPKTAASKPKPMEAPAGPLFDSVSSSRELVVNALKVALQTRRRALVIFGTNGCKPCRTVSDALAEQPFLDSYLRQFIPAWIDVSRKDPETVALVTGYKLDLEKPEPHVVILDPENDKVLEVSNDGALADAAVKKGRTGVQEWFLARYRKDTKE